LRTPFRQALSQEDLPADVQEKVERSIQGCEEAWEKQEWDTLFPSELAEERILVK